jgi:hypothetical protein
MFKNFGEFIALYSATIIGIASLIGFITKGVIQQILNKDLEKFKTNLESENKINQLKIDKEIEKYKSDLNLIVSRQNLLHSKRSELISELYQKLVILHSSMIEMTAILKLGTSKDEEGFKKEELERIDKTALLGNEFFEFYKVHKIYFTEEVCAMIDEIQEKLRRSHSDYSFKHLWGLPPSEMTYDLAKKANEKVKDEVPKLMKNLEIEFRKSIGVI